MDIWTSKYGILRDLFEAQGREVPVDIEGVVSADCKPPALNTTEETEEVFYQNCGDGNASATPDFCLIKHMLNMVRDVNLGSGDDNSQTVPVVSKENTEYSGNKLHKKVKQEKTKVKRKDRNVAVSSILRLYNNESILSNGPTSSPKLLKPDDFAIGLKQNTMNDTVVADIDPNLNRYAPKVEAAFSSPVKLTETPKMFKKKSMTQTEKRKEEKENKTVTLQTNNCGSETYKPSEMADEYYKQFLERTKVKEPVKENIWMIAEKQMKEIEAIQKQQQNREEQIRQNGDATNVKAKSKKLKRRYVPLL